jgi:hypothetical protein
MSTAALDLTTVDAVIRYLGSPDMSDAEKINVQRCITSASTYWLWACGKNAVDGLSPFVQPVTFDETYDGSGTTRMFVRNTPLVSIATLQIDGVAIPPSTAFGVAGYLIDQSKKSITLRGGRRFNYCDVGSNVRLVSQAGFDRTPFDVADKCNVMVAVNYRRRQWIDQSSQAMAQGAGTITFRDWELPPDVVSVMNNYSRTAIVG